MASLSFLPSRLPSCKLGAPHSNGRRTERHFNGVLEVQNHRLAEGMRVSSKMAWSPLVLAAVLLLSGQLSAARYEWTEWRMHKECFRFCSEPSGTAVFKRDCLDCDEDGNCEPASPVHCGGMSIKNDSCYVANLCEGEGSYVGEWTKWTTYTKCPHPAAPCRGRLVEYHRSCELPDAYVDRTKAFQCPGDRTTNSLQLCPCEVSQWNEWSEWSECVDPCGGQDRVRQRSCAVQHGESCEGSGVQVNQCPVDSSRCKSTERRLLVRRETSRARRWILITCFLIVLSVAIGAAVIVIIRRRKKGKQAEDGEPLLGGAPPGRLPDPHIQGPTQPAGLASPSHSQHVSPKASPKVSPKRSPGAHTAKHQHPHKK